MNLIRPLTLARHLLDDERRPRAPDLVQASPEASTQLAILRRISEVADEVKPANAAVGRRDSAPVIGEALRVVFGATESWRSTPEDPPDN